MGRLPGSVCRIFSHGFVFVAGCSTAECLSQVWDWRLVWTPTKWKSCSRLSIWTSQRLTVPPGDYPKNVENKLETWSPGMNYLQYFYQVWCIYAWICVFCVFVLALINWMDRFQHLMNDYNAPCKFSSMLLDAFGTSHSFKITDDCLYAIQWPTTNWARGLEDLGFGWWWDSGCRRIPQRLLEVARSCKDLGRSGHSILEQLNNCQVKSWTVDASGACSHVYLKSSSQFAMMPRISGTNSCPVHCFVIRFRFNAPKT